MNILYTKGGGVDNRHDLAHNKQRKIYPMGIGRCGMRQCMDADNLHRRLKKKSSDRYRPLIG